MRVPFLAGLTLAALSACEGPHQQTGERQDEAAANLAGEAYDGSGPAERVGRAQDQADQAAARAERSAEAARAAQSESIRRQAEVEARRLEEQARAVREKARARSEALDAEAAVTGER